MISVTFYKSGINKIEKKTLHAFLKNSFIRTKALTFVKIVRAIKNKTNLYNSIQKQIRIKSEKKTATKPGLTFNSSITHFILHKNENNQIRHLFLFVFKPENSVLA